MISPEASVIIVGGGPCGLMTALLLARQGVRSVLFEKNQQLSQHPKAMGVSRRTAEIYAQLGLLERMMAHDFTANYPWISVWSRGLTGEVLGRVPISARTSEFTPGVAFHCPQTWTEQVLSEALRNEPLASVNFGAEVIRIEPEAATVRVVVRDQDGRETTVEAPWLVAADGAGSGVRHQLGIEANGPGDLGHFINTFFRADYGSHLQEQSILYQALSEKYFEFFVSVNGRDLWLMHHFLQPGEKAADFPPEKLREMIRTASGLPEIPVEVLSVSGWVMSPKVAREFRHGRIFLTGDAAARLSPAGGLGLNTGLQSAHNLAWKLAAVVQGRAGVPLLDTYEAERRAAALMTMRNTNSNAEEIKEIVTRALADDWDAVRQTIAHSRRGGSGLGQDLGVAYESAACLPDGSVLPVVTDPVNEYVPTARPGSRAPHVWIQQDGARKSILALYGHGWVLVAGRQGGVWRPAKADDRVTCFVEDADFASAGDEWTKTYGVGESGAVLIRPDGYVAARFPTAPPDPPAALTSALKGILALS